MVAQGVNALVVFPDAGEAMLPALRSAYEADVVTVPYRVFPGGEDGKDYTAATSDLTHRTTVETGRTGSQKCFRTVETSCSSVRSRRK